jgi:hypothetical protein
MPDLQARGAPREAQIVAVVTRADGTVEHLGVVSYWHRNPIKRALWRLRRLLRR